ncbi:ATP-binding cassette domain-containing protein [Cohnella lubricantis]|uniref:ATP-binding cassette domain-containing protein n=1 Tax=Cohnella lubricantis TaxID=2163172 RepID=A0A841TAC3_9BACL|nr:ATP-binding cassette domain-containing protein [Cohnella lubricantis]MBB6678443.1 ATP-binding cassette domain-containing protein [Cohnella lubricantis]MBP2116823.1 ABC-2 type transport system ATP-binding protein [Cohnella lubricantis]
MSSPSGALAEDDADLLDAGSSVLPRRIPHDRACAAVRHKNAELWWDVPVIDSYELLRDIYKVPDAVYRANLSMLTETLQLQQLLHTPVRQLSLGQRMRCEIAASLLHGPRILFLDEPTIGLDAVSKLAVRQFIRTLNEEKGVTVILTTHDMSDIEALAERILLIGKGTLLYDGSLTRLRGRFGTRRTITAEYSPSHRPLDIPGAQTVSWSPERAILSVDTSQTPIAELLASLSAQVELADVAIEPMPVDEVIAGLYRELRL